GYDQEILGLEVTQDIDPRRADRTADTDAAGTLPYPEIRETRDAERGDEQQSQCGCEQQADHGGIALEVFRADLRVGFALVLDQSIRINLQQGGMCCFKYALAILRGTAHHVIRVRTGRQLRVEHGVVIGAWHAQARGKQGLHHADHADRVLGTRVQLLAQRVFTRIQALRQGLADDRGGRLIVLHEFIRTEIAAFDQIQSQRRDYAGRAAIDAGLHASGAQRLYLHRLLQCLSGRTNTVETAALAQRQRTVRGHDGFDAWNGAQGGEINDVLRLRVCALPDTRDLDHRQLILGDTCRHGYALRAVDDHERDVAHDRAGEGDLQHQQDRGEFVAAQRCENRTDFHVMSSQCLQL